MNKITGIILITFLAGIAGTGIGGMIAITIKKFSSKIMGSLMGFAAGITLGTVCFHFITEAVHSGEDHTLPTVATVLICMIAGYSAVSLFDRLITKKMHHNHSHSHEECELCESNSHKMIVAGSVMAFSIALHNLPVGMIIGVSALGSPEAISYTMVSVALAVLLHNIPEGMSVSVPFLSAGVKKLHALLITCLCGITTVVGGVVGYYIGNIIPIGLTVLLSLTAGAMLFVVLNELIPYAMSNCSRKTFSTAFLSGFLISLFIAFTGNHNHT